MTAHSRWKLVLPLVLLAPVTTSCTHQKIVRTAPAAPPSIWDRQVRNAVDAGDGDFRLRVLRERMAAEPDNVGVRVELAKAYGERGYHEIALEVSRLAVARFPESGEAQLSLIRDLREVNRRTEAIAALETYLKAHSASTAEYWSWLGILRDESGLWPLGEPAHRRALEITPAADTLHNNLGYNLLMQKKHEEAAPEFREALRLNPSNEIARNNLATALAHSNAAAQAVATWQSATDPASAHNNLAAVWIEKGNYPEARKELDLALGYNRAHLAALRNLELLTRLDGQPATLRANVVSARRQSGWSRFGAGLKRVLTGQGKDSKEETVAAASSREEKEQ
jgi:tetratricopeptide (TPR) repeat protein